MDSVKEPLDEVTPVIFKKQQGTVTAVFPTLLGTYNPYTMSCYTHIGQHGSCDQAWVSNARRAKPEEYANLLAELVDIGYDNLKIVRKHLPKYTEIRRQELAKIS